MTVDVNPVTKYSEHVNIRVMKGKQASFRPFDEVA